jgi:hypothetical protein
LIVNNPRDTVQTYSLNEVSGQAQAFFGEDLGSQTTEISVPPAASVPISLFSGPESSNTTQTVEFKITAEGE